MALQRPETHFNPQFSTHTAQLLAQPPFARKGKTHHLPQEADFPLVTSPVTPPTVKVPVRIKITLPYFVLALLVAMAGAYIVSRVVLDSIEERFTNQLIEAGQLATDQMVREENRLLETWRLLAHMQSLAEAIAGGDAGGTSDDSSNGHENGSNNNDGNSNSGGGNAGSDDSNDSGNGDSSSMSNSGSSENNGGNNG